jgi:DNA-binding transcriptional LysR family regulator
MHGRRLHNIDRFDFEATRIAALQFPQIPRRTALRSNDLGVGIAQIMALGSGHLLAEGKLIDLFPDWPGEVFPLYALYPSRQLRAAKVRTFIDFTSDLLVNSTSV